MFRRLFLPVAVIGLPLAAVVAACSVNAADLGDDEGANADGGEVATDTPSTNLNTASGSDGGATLGNPICGATSYGDGGTCWPDDDGTQALPTGATACAPVAPDGGTTTTATADASTTVNACRVNADNAAPDCADGGANTLGVDGVACATGDDCAPGFDCVDGDNGAVCRRYCCSGSCDGYPAANNGPTFCDVQPVNRAGVTSGDRPIAPVCMPIKSCTLLEVGDCATNETCAIVNDKGATGCVGTNPQIGVGDSCETDHCQAGLNCLGTPGSRTCYKLCRTTQGSDCSATQTCTTSAAFQDTSYGVCTTQH